MFDSTSRPLRLEICLFSNVFLSFSFLIICNQIIRKVKERLNLGHFWPYLLLPERLGSWPIWFWAGPAVCKDKLLGFSPFFALFDMCIRFTYPSVYRLYFGLFPCIFDHIINVYSPVELLNSYVNFLTHYVTASAVYSGCILMYIIVYGCLQPICRPLFFYSLHAFNLYACSQWSPTQMTKKGAFMARLENAKKRSPPWTRMDVTCKDEDKIT